MVDCGVVYMAWGERAIGEAERSIRSLWQYAPGMPVLVVGDADAAAHFRVFVDVTARQVPVDPFDMSKRSGHKFLAGRIKPLLYDLAPWSRVLYVDADSTFVASPERGFALLERGYDLVLAEQSKRSSLGTSPFLRCEAEDTVLLVGTGQMLFWNSGMLFWRRGAAMASLMRLWSQEWQRYGNWDEQIALVRAVLRSDAVVYTAPYTWNCKRACEATLLHHVFGEHGARIEGRGSRRWGRSELVEQDDDVWADSPDRRCEKRRQRRVKTAARRLR